MTKVSLIEHLNTKGNSQEALASAIGYRQSAISNMVKAKRNVFIVTHSDGRIELVEEKIIGVLKTA